MKELLNQKLSLFDNVKSTTPKSEISIAEISNMIFADQKIKGQFQEIQDEIERTGNIDATSVKLLKAKLPAVTFAGTFPKRNNDSLSNYSGLIVIDIDDLNSKKEVKSLKLKFKFAR